MNQLEIGYWFFAVLAAVLAGGWFVDHAALSRRALEAECKFEAIDPIRAEAGVEMSDKCKCFWKDASLEQLRRMK